MRKKDKLYTVNKHNRPLFMPEDKNIFWPGGDMGANSTDALAAYKAYYTGGNYGNMYSGGNYNVDAFKNATYGAKGTKGGNFGQGSGGSGMGWAAAGQELGGMLGDVIDQPMDFNGEHMRHGAWDLLDPFYHASGSGEGLESKAGNAIQDMGVSMTKSSMQDGNWQKAAVGAGLKIVGDMVNHFWGMKTDKAHLKTINESIDRNKNYVSDAKTFDELEGPVASATYRKIYTGGVFSDNKANRKNRELKRKYIDAKSWADRSYLNNVDNLLSDQYNNSLANYAAFGGPVNTLGYNDNMGAIQYDFMSDYLNNKRKSTQNNNQMTNLFVGAPKTMFDFGGDMQTNGGDFGTGLTHVNAGLSHELNPNDGVQMGVDHEGTPNLVEEGEAVFNDYVFSNRITLDDDTKALLHFPKKKDITYADAAKKLEKEIAERPNDPISEAGFKAQMAKLEENQERQKAEMEAARAREAFEALSPEEQTAIMQQAAQQEQMAQQNAQLSAQPTPEEVAMAQPQMMQADGSPAAINEEAIPMAEGGKINKYAEGGYKKNAGSWKKGGSAENWQAYTKNGLRDYLLMINDKLADAETEEEKNKIREEAIKTVNEIQKAYSEAYQSNLSPSEKNEKVEALQKAFEKAGGNAYFGGIANNINLPKGHNTKDTEEKGWVDGYWGPRTSIRNWGSTEYGDADYYNDIAELANEAGLTYAPGEYKYGDHTLYQLGMAPKEVAAVTEGEPELVVDYGDPNGVRSDVVTATPQNNPDEKDKDIAPTNKAGWLRYAGLFGPAVGLGLQLAGVGKPDYSGLDKAVESAGNVALADYEPIGDYLTYRPMDIWYQQNALNAQARATDRALANTTSPSRTAGLIANGYNSQLASGNLYRQALEYNDALREKVAGFNRGTNQFNAEAYNRNSQFNAAARNQANQNKSHVALQAAAQKLDADAGWYNSLYGNIGGLFKGIGDLGRENEQHNMIAKMWADGIAGSATPDNYTSSDYLEWLKDKKSKRAKGGKNHKKHDIIL